MKQLFNSYFIRIIAIFIINLSCVTVFSQRFGKHEVCLPDKGILTATVKITPRSTFSIKNDSKVTWAKYEISDNYVFFSTPVNTTPKNRDCIFILLDGEGNPVDTLKLTQLGKVSNTATKMANGKTVSSNKTSGGGQCAARTKKGTRCSRKAAAGSIYCWQHNK